MIEVSDAKGCNTLKNDFSSPASVKIFDVVRWAGIDTEKLKKENEASNKHNSTQYKKKRAEDGIVIFLGIQVLLWWPLKIAKIKIAHNYKTYLKIFDISCKKYCKMSFDLNWS